MKAGDKVVYAGWNMAWGIIENMVSIKGKPKKEDVCTIQSVCSCCGGLLINEYPIDLSLTCSWNKKAWRKVEPSISECTVKLVNEIFEGDQLGKKKEQYLEEEKVFTEEAEF